MMIFGDHIKQKQLLLLIGSVVFFLGVILTFFVTNNIYYLIMAFLSAFILWGINWVVSLVFEIRIGNDVIHLNNLYRGKRIVGLSHFRSVETLKYPIPPFFSPPYYCFTLTDGSRFIFYDDSPKSFFSFFSIGKKHSIFLTKKINEERFKDKGVDQK